MAGPSQALLALAILPLLGLIAALGWLLLHLGRLRGQLHDTRLREISARQEAESLATQLAAAESATGSLLLALPEPRLILSGRGVVIEANLPACHLLRLSRAELVGRALDEVLMGDSQGPDSQATRLHTALQRTLAGAGPLSDAVALELSDADGQIKALELVLCRHRWAGERVAWALLTDLGPQRAAQARERALEAALERARTDHEQALEAERRQAERASQAKAEFLATLSHELRTPLHAIIGLAHLARAGATPDGAGQLDRLADAARHLLELLTDMLAIAQTPADRSADKPAITDIEALVVQACQLCTSEATRQDIGLVPWFDLEGDALAHAHPDALKRVLQKLVSNAVKFTPVGHVTVRVRRLSAAAPEDKPRLRVEVSDTGIGMPPDVVERLGQPFFRADESLSSSAQGAGIGLALARRLLSTMGATLELRSEPGRGTTAAFELEAATATVPSVSNDTATAHGHVLVVDPLDDARAAHRAHLAKLGWSVRTVASSADALLALRHAQGSGEPITHVLADDRLSAVDLATLSARTRPLGARAPALLLLVNRCAAQAAPEPPPGFAAAVAKPIGAQALSQALKRLPRPAAAGPSCALSNLVSIDVASALDRLRGRPEHLIRLLQQFALSHRPDAEALRQAVAAQDQSALARLAHTLEGAAATISAGELARAAAACQAADASSDAGERAGALLEALRRVLADIEAACGKTTDTPVSAALADRPTAPMEAAPMPDTAPRSMAVRSPEALEAPGVLLEQLGSLLPQRNMSAVRYARQHAAALSQHFGRSGQAVVQALEDFDYDQAQALLGRCASAIPTLQRAAT